MRTTKVFLPVALALLSGPLSALAARSSASYSIAAETADNGGGRTSSASYRNDGSAGLIAGLATVAVPNETMKHGYAGQLYDIVGLSVTAPPSNNVNEAASRQLAAASLADDDTTLAAFDPSTVTWSIVSGPIASISTAGVATAGNVYQDTLATVGGRAQGLNGQLSLTILNVGIDDYKEYASDGIDDAWQVQYFGQPPNPLAGPNADADGTGQNNLFKFVAGLNPLDGSRFTLSILAVNGQPSQKQLLFQPLVTGRTYTPQFTATLTNLASWAPLTGTTQSDNGNQRTVTDPNASPAPRFYRVQISNP